MILVVPFSVLPLVEKTEKKENPKNLGEKQFLEILFKIIKWL